MNNEPTLQELLACAVAAATAAGGHARENLARRGSAILNARHDVKLELDVECQRVAEEVLRLRFPDHAVMGEEDPADRPEELASGRLQWVIDPIDGTINFFHGLPHWCCSVAVRRDGASLAGAVYAPVMDELYTATTADPARLNGRPLRVSTQATAAAAILFTGLDKNSPPGAARYALFERLADAVQRPRFMGCAALDLCHVAAGRGDAYFETGVYVWDIAAAGLILQQAGGRAEVLQSLPGRHRIAFLGSNGLIHDELKRIIAG